MTFQPKILFEERTFRIRGSKNNSFLIIRLVSEKKTEVLPGW